MKCECRSILLRWDSRCRRLCSPFSLFAMPHPLPMAKPYQLSCLLLLPLSIEWQNRFAVRVIRFVRSFVSFGGWRCCCCSCLLLLLYRLHCHIHTNCISVTNFEISIYVSLWNGRRWGGGSHQRDRIYSK